MVRPCCILLVFAHHVTAWVSQADLLGLIFDPILCVLSS